MFNIYRDIKTDVFETNVFPRSVVEVDNDWKFLGDKFSNVMLESKSVLVFSKQELETLKSNLLSKQKWFNDNDIKFYISVPPNKHTIYGDMIPIKKGTGIQSFNN